MEGPRHRASIKKHPGHPHVLETVVAYHMLCSRILEEEDEEKEEKKKKALALLWDVHGQMFPVFL